MIDEFYVYFLNQGYKAAGRDFCESFKCFPLSKSLLYISIFIIFSSPNQFQERSKNKHVFFFLSFFLYLKGAEVKSKKKKSEITKKTLNK